MALEKKWETQGPVPFLSNGGQDGLVVLQDVLQFKVKQKVIIASATQPAIELEVKKIISPTSLYVGPVNVTPGGSRSLDTRTNISAYLVADSAFIRAPEQSKSIPPQADIVRAVYEQEPTTAIRTMVVDKIGRPASFFEDENGNILLGTKTQVKVEGIDVNLDALEPPTQNTPDNVLISGSEDGTKTGYKRAFVNNVRLQILATHDREQQITYADFGTKNQRVTQIDYTSPTFPGIIARKQINYTLVGNRYRRDKINWSIL